MSTSSQTPQQIADVIRRCFDAYQHQDRNAIEPLIAGRFSFTSPHDNHIDRATYFERCWPFNEHVEHFVIEKLFVDGDEAFVRYACKPKGRAAFRNTEFFRVENGQIVEVQVYFGASAN